MHNLVNRREVWYDIDQTGLDWYQEETTDDQTRNAGALF